MNFPPILRFLYRSFQVHLYVVFVVSNFVYICHIPTEQLFFWYIFKTVKHVVYQYNKFTDLYVIGEKKRRKNDSKPISVNDFPKFIETFYLLDPIIINGTDWVLVHVLILQWPPPSHFNVPSEQHMVNFVSVLLWSSLSLCMSS